MNFMHMMTNTRITFITKMINPYSNRSIRCSCLIQSIQIFTFQTYKKHSLTDYMQLSKTPDTNSPALDKQN